jgi:hypothetical protein
MLPCNYCVHAVSQALFNSVTTDAAALLKTDGTYQRRDD